MLRRAPTWCCLVTAMLGAGSALEAVEAAVLSADGTSQRGSLGSDGHNLSVGTAVIPLERVVTARFATGTPAATVDEGVVLSNGDLLAGVVVSMQNGKLDLASDHFGRRTLDFAAVSALVLAPQGLGDLARVNDEPAGARFLNGDRLAGVLSFLNPAAAGLNNGKRIVELPRERLALVRTGSPATATATLQHLRLVTGERISGQLLKLDAGTVTIKHALLGDLALPLTLVATLWSEGGPLTALSTRPATVVQVGFLGPAATPRANGAGNDGPLAVNGGQAEQVLRVHARSELAYALDGGADLLVGEVALDPRGVGHGDAVARVLGDGKVLAEIALGDGTVHVLSVPLTGVRQLTLVSDVGPDGTTTGDIVTWCWPTLVHAAPTAAR